MKWRYVPHWTILLPLAASLAVSVGLGHRLIPFTDQDVYLDQAGNLARGAGLVTSFDQLDGFVRKDQATSFWGAGSQLLYAAEIRAFGPNYLLMRCIDILLFGFTLFYTRRLFLLWLNAAAANVATVVVGMSPFFVIFNQLFMTEMPFLLCQQAFLYHLFQASRTKSSRHATMAGAWAGASVVVRAVLVPILPLATLLLLWDRRKTNSPADAGHDWLRKCRPAASFVFACALIAAPYCIRNSMAVGGWFPLGGKGNYNLWFFNSGVHNHPFWREEFMTAPPHPGWRDLNLNEKQLSDLVGGMARAWIVHNPGKFARLALIKGVAFLNPVPKHMANGSVLKLALTAYAGMLLVAFFAGLRKIRLGNIEHVFVILLFLMYLGIDMVFMAASRHRMLYDPFFVLVGILPFSGWLNRRFSRETSDYFGHGVASEPATVPVMVENSR